MEAQSEERARREKSGKESVDNASTCSLVF